MKNNLTLKWSKWETYQNQFTCVPSWKMLAIKLHRQDGKHPSVGTLKHGNDKMASLWETN